MRMLLGLDNPSAYHATINGRRYAEHAAPLREVGAMLEARAIHTGRSAFNHLLALAATHGIARSRVEEVIDLVGLRQVARKRAAWLLARHGPAPGHRLRAARRPRHADPGRAGQRTRPRGHPVDPQPAQVPCRRRPYHPDLIAPDERDGAHRRAPDRDRPRH